MSIIPFNENYCQNMLGKHEFDKHCKDKRRLLFHQKVSYALHGTLSWLEWGILPLPMPCPDLRVNPTHNPKLTYPTNYVMYEII